MFTFFRPETLGELARQIRADSREPTLRARLRLMPGLDEAGLWSVQARAIRNLEQSMREDLCVPKTSSTSCDQAIFADQGTDARLSSDAVLTEIDRLG